MKFRPLDIFQQSHIQWLVDKLKVLVRLRHFNSYRDYLVRHVSLLKGSYPAVRSDGLLLAYVTVEPCTYQNKTFTPVPEYVNREFFLDSFADLRLKSADNVSFRQVVRQGPRPFAEGLFGTESVYLLFTSEAETGALEEAVREQFTFYNFALALTESPVYAVFPWRAYEFPEEEGPRLLENTSYNKQSLFPLEYLRDSLSELIRPGSGTGCILECVCLTELSFENKLFKKTEGASFTADDGDSITYSPDKCVWELSWDEDRTVEDRVLLGCLRPSGDTSIASFQKYFARVSASNIRDLHRIQQKDTPPIYAGNPRLFSTSIHFKYGNPTGSKKAWVLLEHMDSMVGGYLSNSPHPALTAYRHGVGSTADEGKLTNPQWDHLSAVPFTEVNRYWDKGNLYHSMYYKYPNDGVRRGSDGLIHGFIFPSQERQIMSGLALEGDHSVAAECDEAGTILWKSGGGSTPGSFYFLNKAPGEAVPILDVSDLPQHAYDVETGLLEKPEKSASGNMGLPDKAVPYFCKPGEGSGFMSDRGDTTFINLFSELSKAIKPFQEEWHLTDYGMLPNVLEERYHMHLVGSFVNPHTLSGPNPVPRGWTDRALAAHLKLSLVMYECPFYIENTPDRWLFSMDLEISDSGKIGADVHRKTGACRDISFKLGRMSDLDLEAEEQAEDTMCIRMVPAAPFEYEESKYRFNEAGSWIKSASLEYDAEAPFTWYYSPEEGAEQDPLNGRYKTVYKDLAEIQLSTELRISGTLPVSGKYKYAGMYNKQPKWKHEDYEDEDADKKYELWYISEGGVKGMVFSEVAGVLDPFDKTASPAAEPKYKAYFLEGISKDSAPVSYIVVEEKSGKQEITYSSEQSANCFTDMSLELLRNTGAVFLPQQVFRYEDTSSYSDGEFQYHIYTNGTGISLWQDWLRQRWVIGVDGSDYSADGNFTISFGETEHVWTGSGFMRPMFRGDKLRIDNLRPRFSILGGGEVYRGADVWKAHFPVDGEGYSTEGGSDLQSNFVKTKTIPKTVLPDTLEFSYSLTSGGILVEGSYGLSGSSLGVGNGPDGYAYKNPTPWMRLTSGKTPWWEDTLVPPDPLPPGVPATDYTGGEASFMITVVSSPDDPKKLVYKGTVGWRKYYRDENGGHDSHVGLEPDWAYFSPTLGGTYTLRYLGSSPTTVLQPRRMEEHMSAPLGLYAFHNLQERPKNYRLPDVKVWNPDSQREEHVWTKAVHDVDPEPWQNIKTLSTLWAEEARKITEAVGPVFDFVQGDHQFWPEYLKNREGAAQLAESMSEKHPPILYARYDNIGTGWQVWRNFWAPAWQGIPYTNTPDVVQARTFVINGRSQKLIKEGQIKVMCRLDGDLAYTEIDDLFKFVPKGKHKYIFKYEEHMAKGPMGLVPEEDRFGVAASLSDTLPNTRVTSDIIVVDMCGFKWESEHSKCIPDHWHRFAGTPYLLPEPPDPQEPEEPAT